MVPPESLEYHIYQLNYLRLFNTKPNVVSAHFYAICFCFFFLVVRGCVPIIPCHTAGAAAAMN